MVLLSVTHAKRATRRNLTARKSPHSTGYAHNNCVAPFTSKKHVLLLTVLIQDLAA